MFTSKLVLKFLVFEKKEFLVCVYIYGKSVCQEHVVIYQMACVLLNDFHAVGMSGCLTEIMGMQFLLDGIGGPNVIIDVIYFTTINVVLFS